MEHLDKSKLFYFASPYSHENPFVKCIRYEMTIYCASQLTKNGFRLLEPIAMCHEQSARYKLPSGYKFWKERDRGFIDLCDSLIVLKLPGFRDSIGVSDEIAYAKEKGKQVHYLNPDDIIAEEVWDEIH